ncbi:hypothetical protein EGK_04779 [Macaca mulatta]|nr:hypothetical protein EGK_04779 [Macaca mulatta]EHH55155.1 hypothetical protein EGM_04303 [Macaca fascicularis]
MVKACRCRYSACHLKYSPQRQKARKLSLKRNEKTSQQNMSMFWLKKLLESGLFWAMCSPTTSTKKGFWYRPKTTIIIIDYSSPPQCL